ncbi:MAG: hypothetical protein SH857_12330 [Chitinophagales bacterium]|nr:hypothetical protein [Chitinophagales bacterium]
MSRYANPKKSPLRKDKKRRLPVPILSGRGMREHGAYGSGIIT